jgi:hypothetical protein
MHILELSTDQLNANCCQWWLLTDWSSCSEVTCRLSQMGKLTQHDHKHSSKVECTSKAHHDHYRTTSFLPWTGRGITPKIKRSPIKWYTDEQLTHFIAFIQSPHITTDISFGEQKLELNNGEKITVPDVIRNMIHSRIITQYLAYC